MREILSRCNFIRLSLKLFIKIFVYCPITLDSTLFFSYPINYLRHECLSDKLIHYWIYNLSDDSSSYLFNHQINRVYFCTNHEISNVQAVLDGDLDGFIKAYLMEFGGETKDD